MYHIWYVYVSYMCMCIYKLMRQMFFPLRYLPRSDIFLLKYWFEYLVSFVVMNFRISFNIYKYISWNFDRNYSEISLGVFGIWYYYLSRSVNYLTNLYLAFVILKKIISIVLLGLTVEKAFLKISLLQAYLFKNINICFYFKFKV